MTKISDSTSERTPLKAVAVVAAGGFLAHSAPIFKPRAQPVYILLSYEDRMALGRAGIVERDDDRYQGAYPGALPHSYRSITGKGFKVAARWHNCENQWVDAAQMADFCNARIEANRDLQLTGYALAVVDLCNLAAV
jgi:hypothetical protein